MSFCIYFTERHLSYFLYLANWILKRLNMQRIIYAIAILVFSAITAKGQLDSHFSQYQHTPLLVNPAKAGQIDGDMRLIANYRNQWSSVTVPFSTVAASYDMRIPKYFGKSCSYFGAGIVLLNDQAGDANFRRTNANLALTYNQSLSKRGKPTYMSVGLMVGGGQHTFDPNKLFFDSQFNGDIFDTGLSSGEEFSRNSLLYLDISAGLNFAIALGDKSGVSVGLGMYHLNRPNVSFMEDGDAQLYSRVVFSVDGSIALGEDSKLAVLPTLVFMGQGPDRSFTVGSLLKYTSNERVAISVGGVYRSGDAFIPMLRLDYKPVAIALSYDINVSNLSAASNSNGAMELSLIFTPNIFSDKRDCGAIFCPY